MRCAILVLPLALLWSTAGHATGPLLPGMRLPALTLADQHDVNASVPPETRCVVFSRDMGSAKIVKEAFADGGDSLLKAAGAVVISDTSGMPKVITKLFALPALRKRPYRILLDRDGRATAEFPFSKHKVTLLEVHALLIESIDYVDSAAALRAKLRQIAAPTPHAPRTGGAGR